MKTVAPQFANEPAVEGVRRVVVTLPGVALGNVPRDVEVGGPALLRVRVVRYRADDESGVRVRLDLRGWPRVTTEAAPEGILVRFIEKEREGAAPGGAARRVSPGPPGTFMLLGTLSGSRSEGTSSTTLSTDVAAAQLLPGLFTLEARLLYGEADGRQTYERATGIARGFDLGWGNATAGGGDLLERFGGAGGVAAGVAESLDLRGGGLRLSGRSGAVLELFGGRARGAPFLVRVGESLTVSNEFSGDEVAGVLLSVPLPFDRRFRLGAGWAHTFTSGGPDRDNVFGEIGFKAGRLFDAGVRFGSVSGTRPDGSRLSGTLLGLQGRLSTWLLDVSGTYRDRSSGYVAPGGNQEFPGEKGSTLYATVRPLPHLTLLGSLSESTAFPFQSLDLGTVTSRSRGASVDYTSGGFSAGANYTNFTQKSIGDSANPTDSEGESFGLALTGRFSDQSITLGVARETTTNRMNPLLDLEGNSATVGLGLTFVRDLTATLNARYANTKQTATGERLDDYGGDANVSYAAGNTSVSVGAFGGRTPAGSAAFSADRVGGRAGISTRLPGGFLVSANASYVRIKLSSGDRVESRSFAINLNKALNWGTGPLPGPVGVWDSGEAVSPVSARAAVTGRAFVDANQDGRFSAGEEPVAGVILQAEGVSSVTDQNGRYELTLEPGTHTVRIAATSVPFGYQMAGPWSFTLSVGARRRLERDIPIISSGRVEGRLELKGPPETRPPLDGVGLVLASAGTRRTALTDQDGSFSFGNVPPGTYRLHVEEEDLGEFYGVDGPAERKVRVEAARTVTMTFEIRRLTTRERLERRR